MALRVIDGIMGSGKSYYVVNDVLRDGFLSSNRPIAVTENLEIQWQTFLEYCVSFLPRAARKGHLASEWIERAKERTTTLRHGTAPVVDPVSGRPVVVNIRSTIGNGNTDLRDPRIVDPFQEIVLNAQGSIQIKGETFVPFEVDQMAEFWWFTSPNSLIIYDEAADALNSRKWTELSKTKLQSYINHTRHFKDDLYFIAQSFEDLDKQIREKFHYLHNVRNSLKSPILDDKSSGIAGLLFGGLTWPFQFFIIDTYVREGKKTRLMQTHRVWPSKEGFKNYSSFSSPSGLSGKSIEVSEDAVSEDYGASFWQRSKVYLKRLPGLFIFFGSIGSVIFFLWLVFTGRLGSEVTSFFLPGHGKPTTKKNEDSNTVNPPDSVNVSPAPVTGEVPKSGTEPSTAPAETASPTESAPTEKILLVTPRTVVTTKCRYSFDSVPESVRADLQEYLAGWK